MMSAPAEMAVEHNRRSAGFNGRRQVSSRLARKIKWKQTQRPIPVNPKECRLGAPRMNEQPPKSASSAPLDDGAALAPAGLTEWIDRPIERQVTAITEIGLSAREAMRDGPLDLRNHERYFSSVPALQEIELGGAAPVRERSDGPVRVAVWNVERLRHAEAIAELLTRHRPDVVLLSEVDKGMVRSGNRHGLADLTGKLGHHFAYGVEFVELGLGDESEVAADSGQQNASGFHGNAVTSAIRLHRPFMARLEADGGWFGPARGQQRVGGRMAIGAQIELAGRPVTFVSVHLESNSSPAQRKKQVSHLLDVIEKYDAGAPLMIGGDFNTSTIDRTRDRDQEFQRTEFAADPTRLLEVELHEPRFRLAREQCAGPADRTPAARAAPAAARQDRLDLHARAAGGRSGDRPGARGGWPFHFRPRLSARHGRSSPMSRAMRGLHSGSAPIAGLQTQCS
jgi:endonuclease/exonuclease/phosphatase family metal-dependent hydrolase